MALKGLKTLKRLISQTAKYRPQSLKTLQNLQRQQTPSKGLPKTGGK